MQQSFDSSPNNIYIRPARRGKHKIFIGMAPGVGKTFKMLEEGHKLKQDGVDVVVGLVETHGRRETAAKTEGLEIIPRQQIDHNGVVLTEMDTAAVLARQPQLALVDELAHTNVPGSTHEKRYQDVEILLAAGIDVYSTVNIQHLASLRNVVTSIPGIVVKNPIPDRLLDAAKEVVVVDVTPDTLQERLRHGKIFPSANIEQMLNTTFQWQNLAILRELALRQVANNVEEVRMREGDRLDRNRADGTGLPCCVHERVLVCVSTELHSIQLLRRGAQLADTMNASLHGLFVYNPEHSLSKTEQLYINTCEQLCQDFHGTFLRIDGFNIPETIAHIAKAHHITQVIIGKTRRPSWQTVFHRSIINRLISLLADQTDLHIIATDL